MYQRDAGFVTQDEFDKTFDALADPLVAQRVIVRCDSELRGVDWGSIVTWIADNWATILKVVASIALLFLSDAPRREEQLWSEE